MFRRSGAADFKQSEGEAKMERTQGGQAGTQRSEF